MKCPNCGKMGITRAIRHCRSCGQAYAAADLLELHQLKFLIEETANWEGVEAQREAYAARLETLRERLVPPKAAEPAEVEPEDAAAAPEAATPVVVEAAAAPALEAAPAKAIAVPAAEPAVAAAAPSVVEPAPKPAPPPAPPKEKVPFDQWLLSERNIKIALYAGAVLLVVAGLIFVGVNWARMPGPAKFAIMVMVTGLMYLGGYLLFRRPALRIGGIALLGIASGFVVADLAILQIHVLGPAGLRDDVMWLIASPLCLVLYLATAYLTRGDFFAYLGVAAIISTVTAALFVMDAPWLAYPLIFALLAYGVLWLARVAKSSRIADFTYLPLLITAQGGMAVVVVASIVLWLSESDCATCPWGSPWLAIVALGVGVVFYATTDAVLKWLAARWVAAVLLAVTVALALLESGASDTVAGLVLMLLSLGYMGIGYALERREGQRKGAWPLYAVAYAVALLVTAMAFPDADALYKVLFADVALLVISAAIYRSYWWIWGAVWLFMLPVYLILMLHVDSLVYQGLLMGLLGLNYAIAGYVLGRRSLFLGGPFLSAAVLLSIVAVGFTWGDPVVASLVLGVVAVLYLGAALWQGWPWLLLATLLAVHLLVFRLNDMALVGMQTMATALTITYGVLGLALLLAGFALRRQGQKDWAWPLYAVCALDLAGAYLAGLVLGGPLAVGVSAVMAVLMLGFAWLERAELSRRKLPPLATYAGLAVVFVGHFYVLALFGLDLEDIWTPFTAGLCALFVALAWLLRRSRLADLYGTPLRWAGLVLLGATAVGSMIHAIVAPGLVGVVVTLAIAALVYGFDGTVRRVRWLAWLTVAVVFLLHFFVMGAVGLDVEGVWPAITAGLCAAFVALAWLLRRTWLADLYETPLRWAGLALMGLPLLAAIVLLLTGDWVLLAAVTFAIAALIYGFDGTVRRVHWLAWATVALIFIEHFFVMVAVGLEVEGIWPAITAGLCAAFVALAWLLRRTWLADLYGAPLRWGGLVLMGLPLLAAVALLLIGDWAVLLAVTFAIAGLTYGADGALRRVVWLVYLGIASLVVVIWGVFIALDVGEPQSYILPAGLALLGVGWNERRLERSLTYQGSLVAGLVLLMGSAFVQSLGRGNWPYALLLLVESLVALGWGARKHLRRLVQVGGLALLANGIAQVGPAFVGLSGWIQLGLTGAVLFTVGIVALIKREEILAARQRLTTEWREWEP